MLTGWIFCAGVQAKTIKISAVVNEQKSAEELQEQNDQLLFENSRLTAQLKTLQSALQGDSLSQASRGVLKQALKAAAGKADALDKPTKQTVRIADLRLLKSRLEASQRELDGCKMDAQEAHNKLAIAQALHRSRGCKAWAAVRSVIPLERDRELCNENPCASSTAQPAFPQAR